MSARALGRIAFLVLTVVVFVAVVVRRAAKDRQRSKAPERRRSGRRT